MISAKGKSIAAISKDIAEGFITVNPLFLKPFDQETLKTLHQQIQKLQVQIRSEKFPFNDTNAIRLRNTRLQRLHNALFVIKHFARERGLKYLFI
jgi:hypothetical protein